MGRTVIVGDVHGCREELDSLLDRIAFVTGDKLIFVGDLVARGPDSLGVLDIARRTGAVIVRGNHEEKLLSWHAGRQAKLRSHRKRQDETLGRMHAGIADALREVDWTLLHTSPLFYDLPEHGACVVHAGVLPGKSIEAQEWSTLMYIRCITSRGEATPDKGERLWGASYDGARDRDRHIVFGHNAMGEPQLHPWATGLDTACVYGGRLSALVLNAGQKIPRGREAAQLLVSQPALRQHYDWARKNKVA